MFVFLKKESLLTSHFNTFFCQLEERKRETDRQTDRQIDKETERGQTDRETERLRERERKSHLLFSLS